MKRRKFVKSAALGAAGGAVLAGCGPQAGETGAPGVQTQPRIRWRLASSFPPSLETIYGGAERLAERVEQLTDGRFQIRCYAGGEIVPAFEVLNAVQIGTVQMGHSASYYFKGIDPAFAFDCSVPFGLTARQYNGWRYYGGGDELLRELFQEHNVINLPGGNTGAQMGGWFDRVIGGLADLRGLRMRIPGMGGEVMSRMGVNVQNLPGGEIYPALERGAIDATEWVGPYDDAKLGFQNIVENYYYPGWWEPGPALSFYVNNREWERLPATYQEILISAADDVNVRMLAQYDKLNPPAVQQLVDAGVRLRPFPQDVMERAQEISQDLLASQSSGSLYDEIRSSHDAFRQESNAWFSTAEYAYSSFVFDRAAYEPTGL